MKHILEDSSKMVVNTYVAARRGSARAGRQQTASGVPHMHEGYGNIYDTEW